jgi:DNA-directed RNA polymerase specialized sigma24 family protein
MSVETDRALDAGAAACRCRRNGDAAAEVTRQVPLLERAARGDREAFARLYLTQVDGVYRYLLAWTGGQAAAKELTEQVFRAALAWLPVTGGDARAPHAEPAHAGDVGAWLVAMARDAVAQRREAGWIAGPPAGSGEPQGGAPVDREGADRQPPTDALEAVALLGDPEREVVVLRLLLGHSLAHSAQLSGYNQRAVTELQLAACLAIRKLTGAPDGDRPAGPAPAAAPVSSTAPGQRAAEFERRLERWDVDLTGDDPELADALTVAASLRLAAPSLVVAPDRSFVLRLRAALASEHPEAAGGGPLRSARRALASLRAEVVGRPRPWAATAVAASAILVILTLQAFGSPRPPACGGRPCPATTPPAAAPASATAAPLTSIRQGTTTTSPPPTTALAPISTAPPATSPASSAPRTTRPPRTTTTRQPTTTAATTTSATTTTTGPTTST